MKEHTDGFYIAEEDMKLRGTGNLGGTKQSGFFQFSIADPLAHMDTMLTARKDSIQILREDPTLRRDEHKIIDEVMKRVPPFSRDILSQG